MEMMDRPAIHAAEDFLHAGYPLDVEALLIIELDGPEPEVEHLIGVVEEIARGAGAISVQASRSEEERLKFWAGRKAAFPAVGRISPDYLCMDGTIPATGWATYWPASRSCRRNTGFAAATSSTAATAISTTDPAHDAATPGDLEKVEAFGADILRACVRVGGVLTGEHGVGVEKRDLMGEMFTEDDLKQQQRLKCAFDPEACSIPAGLSHAAPLRGTRANARASRRAALPRYSTVLDRAGRCGGLNPVLGGKTPSPLPSPAREERPTRCDSFPSPSTGEVR